jgi:hypothetical protein
MTWSEVTLHRLARRGLAPTSTRTLGATRGLWLGLLHSALQLCRATPRGCLAGRFTAIRLRLPRTDWARSQDDRHIDARPIRVVTFPGFDHTYYVQNPGTPSLTVDVSLSLREAFRPDLVRRAARPAEGAMGHGPPKTSRLHLDYARRPFHRQCQSFFSVSRVPFTGWSTYPVDVVGPSDEQNT